MSALTLANAASWAVQVAALVLLALALLRLPGMRAPRARLAYFYAVLATCVLLPFAQPWRPPVSAELRTAAPPAADAWAAPRGTGLQASIPDAPSLVFGLALVALAGIGARVVWLGLGIRGLRALRREAAPMQDGAVERAKALVAVQAEVRATSDVPVPVTFGIRPVVLVPLDFAVLDLEERVAILCHELLHVKRHDWVATIGEEVVRALFWFHPAIWWLVDRIQLTREQVVDQQVVALTGGRNAYLDALLRLAAPDHALPAAASPVLRRPHLRQRIALLLTEGAMSRRRLVASFVGAAVVLGCAAVLVVRTLPLTAGTLEQPPPAFAHAVFAGVGGGDAQSVHVVREVDPVYPPEAMTASLTGRVLVLVDITTDGTVSAANVYRRPPAYPSLARAAVDAAGQFRFAPLPAPRGGVPLLFVFNDVRHAEGPPVIPPPPPPPPGRR